jgi:serine-type D-Ala-D-Ala carboxypeptidase (penicillin-binding protein 5/6)
MRRFIEGQKKYIPYFSVALVLGLITGTIVFKEEAKTTPFFGHNASVAKKEEKQNPFDSLSLDARSAFVWDISDNKALYAKNDETQLPLASLTKLMTALLAKETLPKGDSVEVGADAIAKEGDSGLSWGEKWRVSDLVDLTLITSSNDGAHALAASVANFLIQKTTEEDSGVNTNKAQITFSGLMNKKASEIGLTQTFFVNESGLDANDGLSGAYGSARDLAYLISYILKSSPTLLEGTQYQERTITSLDGISHYAKNTHNAVNSIPGILGSKTGFTDLAGGNLAVVFEISPGHPIVAVVLGSTYDGRFEDVQSLVSSTIQHFAP